MVRCSTSMHLPPRRSVSGAAHRLRTKQHIQNEENALLLTKDIQSEVSTRRLRSCHLFDGMDDLRLGEVASLCTWQSLEPGEIAAGKSQDMFFIVCQGKMRVSALSPNGRELLISDFAQGGHFGVVGVMGGSGASLQAQALAPSLLACLTRTAFMKLIREDSIFGRLLLETQQAATEHLMSRLVELGVLRISGRLYSYLLELAEQAGIMDNRSILSPGPRHLDLAARIAASREEVSREMARLHKQGVITSTRQTLVLNDVAALEQRLHAL